MLDEKEEKHRNLARMKAAYKAGLYGNAAEVMNGTASDLIETPAEELHRDTIGSASGTKRKATAESGDNKRTGAQRGKGQKNKLDGYMHRK
jgi:hypothetical protein